MMKYQRKSYNDFRKTYPLPKAKIYIKIDKKHKEMNKMILYAAILETIDPKKDAEILDVHKAYLQKYIDEGKIFAKGPFTDHSGGLVIYKVDSLEEAKKLAENDPAILEKSRTLTLKEWRSNIE